MFLVDTSLWVPIYRDPSGTVAQHVRSVIGSEEYVVALEHALTLLHNDQDCEKVATVRPLKHKRVDLAPFVHG